MTTSIRDVIAAYKEGELSADELTSALRKSRDAAPRHALSEGQKGIWALQKTYPDLTAYNVPICFTVRELREDLFRRACHFLLEQYPILSAAIREEVGVPCRVQPALPRLVVEAEDLSKTIGASASDDAIRSYVRQKAKRIFSLDDGPLLRVHLLRLEERRETVVSLTVHHIVFDGESLSLLVSTLLGAYRALLEGEEPRLRSITDTYEDFVEEEQRMLQSEEGELRLAYWKRNLEGPLPVLSLPTDHPRAGASASLEGRSLSMRIGPADDGRVLSFARKHNISPATFFLGLLKVLLHRYTNESDLLVGMPMSVRGHGRFQGVLGFFVNMIPIRSQIAGDEPVVAFLGRLQRTVVDGMAMQYPFPALVRRLGLRGTGNGSPVFRVAFMYQDFRANLGELGDAISPIEDVRQEGEYELAVEVLERAGEGGAPAYTVSWKYDPALYDESTVARMARQYTVLLDDVLSDAGREVDACSLVADEERQQLLVEWNDTAASYPSDRCVHDLVDEQADRTPDAVALSCGEQALTYAQLKQKSAALASYLRSRDVRPNDVIAIYVDRSVAMVVGLLAILKAGGAYVPLDPDYPEERLVAILEDCGARVIVTQKALTARATRLAALARPGAAERAVIVPLDDEDAAKSRPELEAAPRARVTDLAYVIYTSGTTGTPKGVMIPHRALTNLLVSMAARPGIEAKDKLLAVTTYCFDIAALELYLPLIRGAQCHVCDAASAKDAEKLRAMIAKVRPSIMQGTPSTWKLLFHAGWRNEERVRVFCGGEALPEVVKQELVKSDSEAWNLFGPTETTVWSTVSEIEASKPITIGKPIANTQIHILDRRGRLAPIGVPGELCIAGDGLARGYFNKPAETAEKFVDNPFASATEHASEKLYRTGDLARWRSDGTLEYLGRLDFQIKIRGFRIEVQDIEHQLNTHPTVEASAVVARKQSGSDQLVAYYVPRGRVATGRDLSKELRAHLTMKLPEYMIPAFFVPLTEMPLTPAGKLDRKMLAERKLRLREAAEENAVAGPRADRAVTESKLLTIWREVLGVEDIEPTDGFFDAGGDSVSAVLVAQRVSSDCGVPFVASALFKYSNVRELARHLDEQASADDSSGTSAEPPASEERARTTAPREDLPSYYKECLAIIGISCRLPGADDHRAFWRNLREGKEAARFSTKAELRAANVPEELIENSHYVPMQLTIDGKNRFDRGFFNLTAKDAELMDPQFRLLLTHAWEAIEDAGYACKEIPDTGVYMSVSNSYYQAQLRSSNAIAESDEYQAWLFAQGGTIPTRISYELGLKGPSFFIHSNCSSGLVSLSVAAKSLLLGESKYALIGASTVFPQSQPGYVYQPGLNLSSDGHCRTFDAAADGLTTGEGVAVLLVKPALDAIRDGDHIYALVRGIGINNDGPEKAGYYAPGARGQSAVIQRVLDATGIHPETIDYVEAHGTGTKLGDPVEVSALTDVYRRYTSRKQFCALGSVKPNIGHLDTVAGLSSCIKVALSLKNGEIPASINFNSPNKEIDFDQSPFYVADRLIPWPEAAAGAEQRVRRAAVSSFGIGGTNAHAILEAYSGDASRGSRTGRGDSASEREFVVPLSAKSKERCRAYAERLLAHLEQAGANLPDIVDLSFTLQVGRQAMESRVAFLVRSVDELIEALRRYTRDASRPGECLSGERAQKSDLVSLVEDDDEIREVVTKWMHGGKLRKVAALWVRGVPIDWRRMYEHGSPRRISLPTYPFAHEPQGAAVAPGVATQKLQSEAAPQAGSRPRHPLLRENLSDSARIQFRSVFTGSEFFLRDHVVRGRKMLPGVAYLEMTRTAAEEASGCTVIALQDVVWMKPIVVDADREVFVTLQRDAGSDPARSTQFEVASGPSDAAGKGREVYSQGRLVLRPGRERAPAESGVDIARLRAACPRVISGDQFYAYLASGGGNYGPRFKAIRELFKSETEILARLELPAPEGDDDSVFGLHPSIMDAAFQISDSLLLQPRARGGCLPFFVKEVTLHRETPRRGYAHVRLSNRGVADGSVVKYDIEILDEDGARCVSFKEFTARAEAPISDRNEVTYRTETWIESSERAGASGDAPVVTLIASDEAMVEALRRRADGAQIERLPGKPTARVDECNRENLAVVRRVVAAIGRDRTKTSCKVLLVVPDGADAFAYASLLDVLKVPERQDPRIRATLVSIADLARSGIERVGAIVDRERRSTDAAREIRYDGRDRRSAKQSTELSVERWLLQTDALRAGGVYWLSGGFGALGLSLAHHVASVRGVTLVVTDDQPATAEVEAELAKLTSGGATVAFFQADVSRRDDASKAARRIREEHGPIAGIFHCVGSNGKARLNPSVDVTQSAILAAADGLVHIDEVTKDEPTDFVVFLSPSDEAAGTAPSATRVVATSFVSRFVARRNAMVGNGQRHGKTLAIVSPTSLPKPSGSPILQTGGIVSREALALIQALHHALSSGEEHVSVAWSSTSGAGAEREQETSNDVRAVAEDEPATQNAGAGVGSDPLTREELAKRVTALVKSAVSDVIKSDAGEIEEEKEFGDYGFDSLSLTTLSNKLNQTYSLRTEPKGVLNPTIFFEHPTVQRLAQYLAETYEDLFQRKLGQPRAVERASSTLEPTSRADAHTGRRAAGGENAVVAFAPRDPSDKGVVPLDRSGGVDRATAGRPDDIAIVGISGRFPSARNVDEYWQNLVEGKNCIREIPSDRWDWREYHGDPATETNKTDVKWGGFIEGIAEFDPLFFNISPREALQLDPSHRLLLMHVWLAIEDAGYNPLDLAGTKTAIFAGIAQSGYSELRRRAGGVVEGGSFLGVVPSIGLNRISHFLDLHGPSEPIETACSSSLVAIHRAVTSIQCGDCDMALVGGVQTILTPQAHIGFSKAGMLARDGRCKTFSSRADGFVRGEGIGILFLKRLRAAEADGDAIYGVIKGTAVNHDGRSNTLTSPNPKAQRDVIVSAHERAGTDPRSVGYIETHGTGTTLGDPIEINALKDAFERLYRAADARGEGGVPPSRASCALGAVKTNVGHLELAAGVSGVIKVLMQLKHGQLVKSLHCDEINPYIELEGTPFYVQQRKTEWEGLVDGRGNVLPRRAGISSFGIGGVNAHVVIEEYRGEGRVRSTAPALRAGAAPADAPVAIVLSAKDTERLMEYAEALLHYVRARARSSDGEADGKHLRDVAYTLQIGRAPMPERLGVLVSSLQELEDKLAAFLAGTKDVAGLHRGRATRSQDQGVGGDLEQLIAIWIAKGKLGGILDRWVKGTPIDWTRIHTRQPAGAEGPRRIHLPGYPFAREHYWVTTEGPSMATPPARAERTHPLLHDQTSDASGVRFRTCFTGDEFFLVDHRVNGSKVLPGVAYLEMACEAFRRARGEQTSEPNVRLKNVAWVRPMTVAGQTTVVVELRPQGEGSLSFAISTEGARDERLLHCEGLAELRSGDEAPARSGDFLDLVELRTKCDAAAARSPIEAAECYEAFERVTVEYGPAFRGMERCYAGELGVLAKLALPPSVRDTKRQFTLHPSVLDSALQSAIGLDGVGSDGSAQGGGARNPALPFALDSLEVLGESEESMWAWVRPSRAGDGAARGLRKVDIDLCDEAGAVRVKLRGLSSRVLALPPRAATATAAHTEPSRELRASGFPAADVGMLARAPLWDVVAFGRSARTAQVHPSKEARLVVLGGTKVEQLAIKALYPRARLSTELSGDQGRSAAEATHAYLAEAPIDHLVWIAPEPVGSASTLEKIDGNAVLQGQEDGVLQLFRVIKALLAAGYGTRDLSWTVITRQALAVSAADAIEPTHASAHGLVGSMAKEYPYWKVRLLDTQAGEALPVEEIFSMPYCEHGNALAYRNEDWYARTLAPVHELPASSSLYKTGGVYVVIGGAGGIGAVWSQWMIERYQAKIVWLGRRAVDATIRRKLEEISKYGTRPVYIQADAGDKESMEAAYRAIADLRWGGQRLKTSGVVHSAIVLADASLATMDEERFNSALRSKVDVSVRMAEVFGRDPLDFMLFFSSITSFGKTAGQSNYAAGCVFKDAFARRMSGEMPYPVKVVNWGYWGSVGVVSDSTHRDRMAKSGFGSIEPEEGMPALEALLGSAFDQLVVVKTLRPDALGKATPRSESVRNYASEAQGHGSSSRVASAVRERLARKTGEWETVAAGANVRSPELEALVAKLLLSSVTPYLQSREGLDRRHARWLEESFATLVARGDLAKQEGHAGRGGAYSLATGTALDADALWEEWRQKQSTWSRDASKVAPMKLAEACLRALPRILRGECRATEVIFPGSTMQLVEGLYKGNRVVDLFNDVVHQTVLAYVDADDARASARPIHVIEIGAGTGGTTAGLLPKLEPVRTRIGEYCYTDLSHAFLLHAREHYAPKSPFLRTQIFNVEKPIGDQGIAPDKYDLAIATNVLHATKNIRQTLRNAKAALRAGGLLVLNELSQKTLFSHVTFGLLDGWWLYEDNSLRIPGSPGLYPEAWRRVLEEEGYESVFFPAQSFHHLGQQIIVAQSDGVVRQRLTKPLASASIGPRSDASGGPPPARPIPIVEATPASLTRGELLERAHDYLKDKMADVLKVPREKIEVDVSFASYGTDSILALALIRELEKDLGSLPKTLFFEHETIVELGEYLLENHAAKLEASVGAAVSDVGGRAAGRGPDAPEEPAPPAPQSLTRGEQVARAHDYLKDKMADVLKVPREKIEVDVSFASYGTDSILALALIRELEKDLGSLPKTLFFEHETIVELGDYLLDNHADNLQRARDQKEAS